MSRQVYSKLLKYCMIMILSRARMLWNVTSTWLMISNHNRFADTDTFIKFSVVDFRKYVDRDSVLPLLPYGTRTAPASVPVYFELSNIIRPCLGP